MTVAFTIEPWQRDALDQLMHSRRWGEKPVVMPPPRHGRARAAFLAFVQEMSMHSMLYGCRITLDAKDNNVTWRCLSGADCPQLPSLPT